MQFSKNWISYNWHSLMLDAYGYLFPESNKYSQLRSSSKFFNSNFFEVLAGIRCLQSEIWSHLTLKQNVT